MERNPYIHHKQSSNCAVELSRLDHYFDQHGANFEVSPTELLRQASDQQREEEYRRWKGT